MKWQAGAGQEALFPHARMIAATPHYLGVTYEVVDKAGEGGQASLPGRSPGSGLCTSATGQDDFPLKQAG